jgi:hypothetical protein
MYNRLIPALALSAAAFAAPLEARPGATMLEEQFKSAINGVVQEVRSAEDAAAKREALEEFTGRMDLGLEKILGQGGLDQADRATLAALKNRFAQYRSELQGKDGLARVEDESLDAFAAYIQQDLEQAPVGGGIYISAGALIIILLLLLILT